MSDPDVIEEQEDETADRVGAAVQHALKLVGPAEGGAKPVRPEDRPVS